MARLIATALLFLALAGTAGAEALNPFKDQLFSLPDVLATSHGGAHVTVDYREMRDINGRDEIPERRARSRYVSLGVRGLQKDLVLKTEAGDIPHVAVGKREGASVMVLYLHGQGGNRHQGVDDFSFGGNFNRIKNLVAENGGLYLSPDFSDFGAKGAAQVATLIAHYAEASPDAEILIACGSAGGALCWQLADSPGIGARLDGLLLLGSHWDDGFLRSKAFAARVSVYFGHGSRDTVFPVAKQEAFFERILAAAPNYPTRFVRFETGTHGTPIRMTDWREVLNWMLEAKR